MISSIRPLAPNFLASVESSQKSFFFVLASSLSILNPALYAMILIMIRLMRFISSVRSSAALTSSSLKIIDSLLTMNLMIS
jgi:hypothetical protein